MNKTDKLKFYSNLTVAWAVAFALPNLYWLLGGKQGTGTIGLALESRNGTTEMSVMLVIAVLGKLFCAVLAKLLQDYFSWAKTKLAAAALISSMIFLYGLANLATSSLMTFNVMETPKTFGMKAARWHAFFWSPIWLLGGVVFMLATYQFSTLRSSTKK